MSNILNPIFDYTTDFRSWATYIYSILKKNKYPNIKDILAGYSKDIIDSERVIRNNIITIRNLDPKSMDSKFSAILFDIEYMFKNIESFNSKFEIERVKSSFEYLNVKWNESQFELIKELSAAVVPILENTFKNIIKYSIDHSLFNSDPKFKRDLFNSIKSSYILAILKHSNGETIYDEKESDPIAPKTNINQNYSFIIDYRLTMDMNKDLVKKRKEILNDSFFKMLIKLKENSFITDEATPSKLKGLVDTLNVKNKIQWTGSVGSLHYFVKSIGIVMNDNYSFWDSAVNCFLNKENESFNVESVRSDYKEKDYKASKTKMDLITKPFLDKIKSFPGN